MAICLHTCTAMLEPSMVTNSSLRGSRKICQGGGGGPDKVCFCFVVVKVFVERRTDLPREAISEFLGKPIANCESGPPVPLWIQQ